MKRLRTRLIVAAALAAAVAVAQGVPQNVHCTLDDTPAMWQSDIKYYNNHAFFKFQCMQGHVFWVRGD